MPELPEVETIVVGLNQEIIGYAFLEVSIRNPNLRKVVPNELVSLLPGSKIIAIKRKAKYILWYLDNGSVVIIHLGMTGKLIIYDNNYIATTHDHVIFYLNNNKLIVFNDIRRFGLITVTQAQQLDSLPIFSKLGIEPLSEKFDTDYLSRKLTNKNIPIKTALMDNNIMVGVGNIYSNEALFRSGISPIRISKEMNQKELSLLVETIKQVLTEAINLGGSTFKNYVSASGKTGSFQNNFNVYNRYGKNCFTCDSPIIRIKQAGRSTFYCSNCQQ